MTLEKFVAMFIVLAVMAFVAITWEESRADRARLESAIATQQELVAAAEIREQTRDATLKVTLAQIASEKSATQTPDQILSALKQTLHLPEPITLNTRSIGAASQESDKGIRASASTPELPTTQIATDDNGRTRFSLEQPAQIHSGVLINGSDETELHPPNPIPFAGVSDSDLKSQVSSFFLRRIQATTGGLSTQNPGSNSAAIKTVDGPHSIETATVPTADLKPLFDQVQDCRSCRAQLSTLQADLIDEQSRASALTKERDAVLKTAKGDNLWHRMRQNAKWLAVGAALSMAASRIH